MTDYGALARKLLPYLQPALGAAGSAAGVPAHTHNYLTKAEADARYLMGGSFDGAGLVYAGGVLAVGQGDGLTVGADAVGLTTPGTLTVSSTNSAVGSHTHAVTASDDVSAQTAALLKSTGTGGLTLYRLAAALEVQTPKVVATGALTLAPANATISVPTDGVISNASGGLTISPAGDLTLNPGGSNVLPGSSIEDDLGDYNRKWRTLYASELYVETLVAQDVLSTIGGRILVAPTTTLIADAASGATTVDVKHNNLANGDFVYLSSAPGGVAQVEAMKITSGATVITGGYRYSVTRNLDGSGANAWVAGDALANLGGAVGEGYFDITATQTIHNHLGPTLTGYVRTATTGWNSVKPVTAQGNLRSFVDYASDEFGFATGNDLTLTPSTGFQGVTIDRTNGTRLFNVTGAWYSGATEIVSVDATDGIAILASALTGYDPQRAYSFFRSGGTVLGGLYARADATYTNLALTTEPIAVPGSTRRRFISLTAGSTSPLSAEVSIKADYNLGSRTAGLNLTADDASTSSAALDARAIYVGTNQMDQVYIGNIAAYAIQITGGASPTVKVNAPTIVGSSGTPAAKLHAVGDVLADTNGAALVLRGTDHVYAAWWPRGSGAGRKAYAGFGAASSTQFNLINEDTGALLVQTNGNSAQLFLAAGGNVAVGNSTASEKLHVSGKVLSTAVDVTTDPGSGTSGRVSFVNASNWTISSGVGNVRMTGTTARTNVAWLKVYIGTAVCWVPVWDNIS